MGIPCLKDRAEQALLKLALEPEWEARFEKNSYGFRPGRSAHDAVEAIFLTIKAKAKYVLDADIAKCFDRINQKALLTKLQTCPTFRRAINAWLKAGVIDTGELFPTTAGVPQGGVISPLLMNIALHGLETAITTAYPNTTVIRYADDLVALHPDLTTIHQVQQAISDWLATMGLELKPSKTRITHTLTEYQGHLGFDFLGFNIRQYPIGKTHSGKTTGRKPKPLGFKTIIKPSQEAQRRHYQIIKSSINAYRTAPQAGLIKQLNPIIRGWTAYHATVCAKKTFSNLANQTFNKLYRWARRRHPGQSWKHIKHKYWRLERGRWDFAPSEGTSLYRHDQTPIKRHIKVRGAKSPYDGDWMYWAKRNRDQPGLPKRTATLLHRQAGKCARCGLYLKSDDSFEIDHIIPKSQGGNDSYDNWQILHTHCHHRKTSHENRIRSAADNSQPIEERCEPKGSRTVLNQQRAGRPPR